MQSSAGRVHRAGAAFLVLFALGSFIVSRQDQQLAAQAKGRLGNDPSISAVPDFVSVNQSRGLDVQSIDVLRAYFDTLHLSSTIVHQGTLDLTSVSRQGVIVRSAPTGTGFPISTLAVDGTAIKGTMGDEVGATVGEGRIVMGASAASQNGVLAGDLVTLMGWNGIPATFEVGSVQPDPVISGVEAVISLESAAQLGFTRPFSIRAWGFDNREAVQASMQVLRNTWKLGPMRIRFSWQEALLDDTVPQASIKVLLGDFWVKRSINGTLQIDPGWKSVHIASVSLPLVGRIRCNPVVATAAAEALQELADAGLAPLIHATDSRLRGGCFSARETRSLNGNSGHNLSRHTWGAAIDINPSQNQYGGASRMDGRVIDAFRRHGFVWGGSFLVPDPMHFEFVGR